MLSQRFWAYPTLAISFSLLATLILAVGCGSETARPTAEEPVQEIPKPALPTATESSAHAAVDPEPDPSDPADQPAVTDAVVDPNSVAQMAADLPASSEPGAADHRDQAIEPRQPTPLESAQPAEPVTAEPAATEPAATEPAAIEPVESALPVASPAEMDPRRALPPPQPLRPSPQPTTAPKPTQQFAENPLREGTDDFPTSPAPTAPLVRATPDTSQSPSIPAAEPEKRQFSKGKHNEDYDPIAENGEIFVDWKKPKIALVISGRQDGYLEPCGCAGLDRMKGGLTRRHSLFKQLRADGWSPIGLDCGGLIKGFGRQAELKFGMSVDAMQQMGYSAIGLGKSDLRLPATELLARVATTPDVTSPFLSANVAIFGFEFGMTADHRIVEAGGMRVGITSVLGAKWQKEINNPEIAIADPAEKLREVLPKMKGRSDLLVLLAHATMEESKALAEAFPEFDIVVTAGGDPEPPEDAEQLAGNTKLVQVGEKGMNAIVLGIYEDGKIQYQRVPLDSRFEDSPDMKEFMRQYQEQLKADGLAGLGIRQVPHPQAKELGKFIGSKKCVDCHEPSYDVWKKSGHADAWKTLAELEVPRTHDPECISCHVIGWHPTEYFPYESGFLSEPETPELVDVGCESCHGPGEKHVDAEMGTDEELQKKLQKAMVVTKDQMRNAKNHWCLNCHDLDNSPDFNFDDYWPEVEHSEDIWEDE